LTACRPIPKAFVIEGKTFVIEGIFIIAQNRIHIGNLFLDNSVAQKKPQADTGPVALRNQAFDKKPGFLLTKKATGWYACGWGDSHEKGETTRGQAYSNNAQQLQLGWCLSN
jgi:hypothetical protein